jgi:FkbM family methyltransferase
MLKKIINRIKWTYYDLVIFFVKKRKVGKKSKHFFLINTNSAHELNRALTFYEKEPEMIEWIDSLLKYKIKNDFVFWDIGANIGIYTLYIAKKYNEAKVFSFEPESNNFSALCNNILLNNFNNVYPFMVGLSNITGYDNLHISVMSPGAGAASIAIPYKYTISPTIFKQGIYISKADDIIKNKIFPIPNFIKIDVDGHERKILSGSHDLFAREELLAIMLELEYVDSNDLNIVISEMNKFGFNLSKVSNWKDLANDLIVQNFLFERMI